jgi:7-carboxy-7-deazaguanine synthase
MEGLLQRGHDVLLETGGHVPLDAVPDPVVAIVDVKCPGSGEADRMHWPNLEQLSPHDEVKFVIADRADFDYAASVVERHRLQERAAAVLFSPVHGVLAPADLARWILESRVPARLQLQAHKYIWSPEARGV